MTATPAISIIVPCHNDGRFLDGLLASLRAQTFQDYEIVIVDDGSKEAATLAKLNDLESVVRIVRQENRFLPGARNTGFREARAEFVLPLDCDDRLEPPFLAETLAAIRGSADNVAFAYTYMQLAGGLNGVYVTQCNGFNQLFLNHLPYCLLIRKTAWQAVGGYDETMRDGMEDWEFNIRLLREGYKGVEIPKPLFVYTVRPDGMLLSKSARSQATIWRRIRGKFPEQYRIATLVSTWRKSRPGWWSTLRAVGLYTMARALPEGLCNILFFKMNMIIRKMRVVRVHPRSEKFTA